MCYLGFLLYTAKPNPNWYDIETVHLRLRLEPMWPGLEPSQNPVWDSNPCGWDLNSAKTLLGTWTHVTGTQFSSVAQSCLCNPMDCNTPGLPAHHQLPEFTQTHVHWIRDAIQPSHPLSSPSPPAFSLSQHQDLFRWVSSSHQVAKVLEFQLQQQSFRWIFRTDFL